MNYSDDDISGPSCINDNLFSSMSQVDNEDTPLPKRPRKSAEGMSYSHKKQQLRLPTNLQQISQMKNHLTDQLKGIDIDANLSLRIV